MLRCTTDRILSTSGSPQKHDLVVHPSSLFSLISNRCSSLAAFYPLIL